MLTFLFVNMEFIMCFIYLLSSIIFFHKVYHSNVWGLYDTILYIYIYIYIYIIIIFFMIMIIFSILFFFS